MLKLPYGVSNFVQLTRESYYYVDRTAYIAQLEQLPEQIYTIHSEFESDRRYVDLLLTRRPPIEPAYQFAFELKYLKQSDAQRLEAVKAEGLAQMQEYLQHARLRALADLRAWLVVFVGPKAQVVMEVLPSGDIHSGS